MFSLSAITRRDVLRIGALSVFGGACAPSAARSAEHGRGAGEQRARSCIFMMLQGGPSHLDLWDPKPDAPAEVRGPFQTIETALAGVRFGELLVRSAKIAQRLAIVRSMTHAFNNHIAGTYITLTGSDNQPNQDREADAKDAPGPGAALNYLWQARSRLPVSVSLPNWLSIPGPSNRMPGQYAGLLGAVYDPFLIAGEPQRRDYRPMALSLPPSVSPEQLHSRVTLRRTLDEAARQLEKPTLAPLERFRQTAHDLLTDPKVREAVDLTREPDAVRDRYGRTKIGQSLLLARRLVEAGVRFVEYNEFNQAWDHHGDILRALKNLAPPMEQAFAALVEDLHERGLLDSTLVVNAGEFGRTPVINPQRGRDHWPDVYTTVLAGGGIRAGQVYGASDAKGAYVKSDPVSPADLLATMWHLLGVDPHTTLHDRLGRPLRLSSGNVVAGLV